MVTPSYIRISAGTKNELKLRAIQNAFYKAGILIELEGYDVPADVPKQPFSRLETREGAKLRAIRAIQADRASQYGIGIESGIILEGNSATLPGLTSDSGPHFEVASCIIVDRKLSIVGGAWSAAIETPKEIMNLILKENMKSYEAVRHITGKVGEDTIKYYTGGRTNREEVLTDAVFLALAKIFLNPEAYLR